CTAGAPGAPAAWTALLASAPMPSPARLAIVLAIGLGACALAVPAAASGAGEPATTAPAAPAAPAQPSPFRRDRASSKPMGLSPDTVATPFRYPDEPVVLTWGAVPGAAGYTVEVSS